MLVSAVNMVSAMVTDTDTVATDLDGDKLMLLDHGVFNKPKRCTNVAGKL